MNWRSWRLILTTIPFAVGVVLLAIIRRDVFHINPVATLSDIGSVITATVLIIGFMLAGVLADHKESERLPNQLTSQLATYLYSLQGMVAVNGAEGSEEIREAYYRCALSCKNYFLNTGTLDTCLTSISELNETAARSPVTQGSGVSNFNKVAIEGLPKIRETVGRIDAIRRTGFLPTGYSLLRLMVAVAVGLLIFADVKFSVAQYFICGIVSLVMFVLIRLITDLDDPFDYTDGEYVAGSNEVDPHSIVEFTDSLPAQLDLRVTSGISRT